MEPLAPFELEALRRDWIEGLSGDAFFGRVEIWRDRISKTSEASDSGCGLAGRKTPGSFLFKQSESGAVSLVVCEEEPIEFAAAFFAGVWSGIPLVLTNPRWAEIERQEFDDLMALGAPQRGAILIPTGGTTGGVKLATHDWASLSAAVRGLQDFLKSGPIHSCCLLPLYHVSGLMQLVRSFLTGGCIRFDDGETKGYCLSLVPTQLKRALEDESALQKINQADVVFVGGAALSASLAAEARRLKLPIIPVYGMTETAAMIAAIPCGDFQTKPDAGAVPMGSARLEITPSGQIRVQSPALFKGYYGRPELDLSDGYVTGDIGRLDTAGRLHVLGRADDIIVTGGEKVDPGEVERALLELEGVLHARVVGEAHPEWGRQVVAYISGPALNEPERSLHDELRPKLASYKIPKKILPET